MFYDRFRQLAAEKGVSVSRAAKEIGLSSSAATKWKNTSATPSGETLAKISDYFGVSVDFLLAEDGAAIGFDDFTYAMSGEGSTLSADEKQELLRMARFFNRQRKRSDEGS